MAVRGMESVHERLGAETTATAYEVRRLMRHRCVIGHDMREATVVPKMKSKNELHDVHDELYEII